MGICRSLLCILAALLSTIAVDAHAEPDKWFRYDIQGGRAYLEVNFNSLTITGNVRRVAVRAGYSPPITTKDGNTHDFMTSLQDHNCETGEMRIFDAESFLKGEKVPMARTSMDWRKTGPTNQSHKDICNAFPPSPATPIAEQNSPVSPPSPGRDEATQLQKLKELLDKELITADEFKKKRQEILDRL